MEPADEIEIMRSLGNDDEVAWRKLFKLLVREVRGFDDFILKILYSPCKWRPFS